MQLRGSKWGERDPPDLTTEDFLISVILSSSHARIHTAGNEPWTDGSSKDLWAGDIQALCVFATDGPEAQV